MKLSDYPRIEALVTARNHLVGLKDERPTIAISISGHRQTREFVKSVEGAILLELRYRIHEIDQELSELGVIIDI